MRIKFSIEPKLTVKQVFIFVSSAIVLLTLGIILLINLGDNRKAYAAANGDFQSRATGNWNSGTVWQKYNFGWSNTASTPSSADGVITILSGHTITLTANATVDQLVINSGGTLIINSGVTLTLANGTGTDLSVSGIVKNAGTITINVGATIIYQNGGKYQHNYTTTAGTIPTATWSSGSTCEIIGYTSNNTAPAGLQVFDNFTWNCPGQSQDISLGGGITTINGDFTIVSTGTKNLRMSTSALTLSIGSDFIQSGGNFDIVKGNVNSTVNIAGDYSQSGGVFQIDGNNPSIINLSGNMSHTGGTITESGNGNINFVFKKAGTQTYTASGNTVTNDIDYTVNSGATLSLGTNIVKGRNFTVLSGGGLGIGALTGVTASTTSGNIQVSGTRSFNAGADYTFSGTSAQYTGDGLPATVRNFTVNNASGVSLTNNLTVSGTLTFTNGDLLTESNEINITNPATTSITGYNSSRYVCGTLRRAINTTGSYDFPVGTATNYELLNLNLSSLTGPTNIVASFSNSSPLIASLPLVGVIVNNLTIDKMLTYGYWSLTPNLPRLTGSYTLTATELLPSMTVNSGCSYSLLNRLTNLLGWASQGIQSPTTQTVTGNAVTAVRSGLTLFGDFSIGYGELLSFSSPTLISGVAGQPNATYLFPDACSNVDAWVQIVALNGGATLNSIDNYATGNGYPESWQPYIDCPPNKTSDILWKLSFKVKGTSTDTILPWLAISGVDIDAGSNIIEFVEAGYPYSYGLSTGSPLTITNTNGAYRATANVSIGSLANIDTAQHQAMFQINYKNVNSFYYKTGVISTNSTTQTRQTSLYFKSFFSNNLALPIQLTYFRGKLTEGKVNLNWATASEVNNNYFIVERSSDGETFEPVNKQRGAGNSTMTLYYSAVDPNPLFGKSYYRLKQIDNDGHTTYSDLATITNNSSSLISDLDIKSISPNPFTETFTVDFIAKEKKVINVCMLNSVGQVIAQEQIIATEGYNNYQFPDLKNLSKGVYFISLSCNDQKITKKVIRK